jgi:predicted peptidase
MKKRTRHAVVLLVCLQLFCLSIQIGAAQSGAVFEKRSFQSKKGIELPYRILYPANYNPKTSYPLVLFLHGAGERGNDNEIQLVHGSSLFIENQTKFPAIVVFPQCRKESYWSSVKIDRNQPPQSRFNYDYSSNPETEDLSAVIELLSDLKKHHKLDKKRVYIMGLSMGGMGTFEALSRHSKLFAAAIPICGGGDTTQVGNFAKKVPVWVFHGADDSVVHADYSRSMVKAIEAAGGKVKYTEYPKVNHNSWDNAFAEPELLSWLFKQRK